MTTLPSASPEASLESLPPRRRWSLAEFHRIAEEGFFQDQRVELLDGEVLTMSPMGPAHKVALILVADALKRALPSHLLNCPQIPFSLADRTEVVPDVVVVAGPAHELPARRLSDCGIVIEIADSSLAYDLGKKAQLYAQAAVSEYWVLDLIHRRLVVHRDPVPTLNAEVARYKSITTLEANEEVEPGRFAGTRIAVSDVIPS